MNIDKLTIKFLGKKETVYRVFKDGELIRIFTSKEEAEAFLAA